MVKQYEVKDTYQDEGRLIDVSPTEGWNSPFWNGISVSLIATKVCVCRYDEPGGKPVK